MPIKRMRYVKGKSMKKFVENVQFRTKLFISFAAISIMPMVTVIILSYIVSTKDIMEMSEEYTTTNMEVVASQIDSIFENAQTVCDSVENNINIQEYIRKDFWNISERYSYDLKASMELLNMYSQNEDIYGIYILGDNGAQYKSNYCSFQNRDFGEEDWYSDLKNREECKWFVPHSGSYIVKTVNTNFISVGKAIIDKASGESKGIIMADLQEAPIVSLLDQYQDSENGFIAVDENGRIIFKSSFYEDDTVQGFQKFMNEEKHLTHKKYVINQKSYIILQKQLSSNGWELYTLISMDKMQNSTFHLLMVTLVILFSSIIFTVILIFWNSNTIIRPIRTLSYGMHELTEGNLNVLLKKESNDEMGCLIDNFNTSVSTMREMNEKIYEEQENLRKAEFKALQAQINPHFLYNSLDSIAWLLRLDHKEDAIKMVSALTKLFKVVLSKGKEFIPVSDELCHAENYLLIQKIRYKNKFEYHISADENIKKYRVIKLILQPLIENAIYHGIDGEAEYEIIHIEVTEQENNIIFEVKDSGQGMKPKDLQSLREAVMTPEADVKKSYGLRNISDRLKVYYSGKADMQISSEWGRGTTVRIKIPKEAVN